MVALSGRTALAAVAHAERLPVSPPASGKGSPSGMHQAAVAMPLALLLKVASCIDIDVMIFANLENMDGAVMACLLGHNE